MPEQDRKTFIGGSDTAAILGLSPWKTPLQIYLEKTGEWVEEITPAKQKIFNRGKRFEPVVAEMLIDELTERGHDVEVMARNQRYTDHEFDFLAAEIDLDLLVDGLEINAEIKTVHPFAAKDWGELNSDEMPLHYVAQIVHGQMVTERGKTVVAALIGTDDLRLHFVHRDEELINHVRERELAFWKMVQDRTQPPPINPEDVMRLYEWDDGDPIQANLEMVEHVDRLRDLKAKIRTLNKQKEEIEKEVKLYMGPNAILLHDLMPLVSWKSHVATRLDIKRVKEDDPKVFEKYKKETIIRTFLLK